MPKNTQSQKFQNTASYGQIQPESNKYIDAFANFQPQMDPTIPYAAAASRNRLNASINNPLGGYGTAQTIEAKRNAANRDIDQQAAMATRAGAYDVNQQQMGQKATLAGLMAPRIVQTGSSGNSSAEQGKNAWGNAIDLGLGAASIF